ncbi:unnamed protein product [Ceutorhynchus assimilis]|uniref:TTF-type domain-containing protein n=1 Tax=Ceutorhynchus assimilis TaxID=467358 RepID=A0A9N9MFF9_9CUCU|nr:unnamed protein product [Ceutorhynchus assimilis]
MSSDGRKRLSGYQYRKRKLEKRADNERQAGALEKFLKKKKPQQTTDCAITSASTSTMEKHNDDENMMNQHVHAAASTDNNVEDNEDTHDEVIDFWKKKKPQQINESNGTQSQETTDCTITSASTSTMEKPNDDADMIIQHVHAAATTDNVEDNVDTHDVVIDSDPAKWPGIIMDKDRVFLVKRGPPPPLTNYNFPLDKNGRKFTPFNYNRVLSNGESVKRNWLTYSTSKNVLFCFCCKLFDHTNKTSLCNEGFNHWKPIGNTLKNHEVSMAHLVAQKSWSELSIRLNQKQVIDASMQRIIDSETRHWTNVLQRIISIIQCLGESCLALRGSSDKLFENNNGNFLKLVQLLAKFDPIMEEHVNRVMRDNTRKSKQLDLPNAINILDKTNIYLNNLRSDDSFNRLLVDAKELADAIDVDAHFPEAEARARTQNWQKDNCGNFSEKRGK